MLSEKDIEGVWRLKAHFYLEDDGSTSEGPLGDRADGLLIYHADGYMAASLMRTEPPTGQSDSPQEAYLGSVDDYLGYSGRWHIRDDDLVVHQVAIGSHSRVVNTEQVREARMHKGVLRLQRRLGGPHAYVVMDWRRV
ncbi:lipocalin-like domain-containing protein [Streptomyces atratus]|uniref:lipocalin-like domain-containing protein n=1 Tax=Streptomyces atratus TaxID=1893 RepID=UPI00225A0D72|nr:lipocalin-like domain-containing protein [Streptomyces atratus]MCX5339137.1 lipocalin-like domain-containing protein [Streptomyces atratus]